MPVAQSFIQKIMTILDINYYPLILIIEVLKKIMNHDESTKPTAATRLIPKKSPPNYKKKFVLC